MVYGTMKSFLKTQGIRLGMRSLRSLEAQESKNEVRKPKPLKSCLTSC